jgi:hypothetical protein
MGGGWGVENFYHLCQKTHYSQILFYKMPFRIPPPLLTDSYKTTHPEIYPEAQKMVAYGEFRCSYEKDPVDTRIVSFPPYLKLVESLQGKLGSVRTALYH